MFPTNITGRSNTLQEGQLYPLDKSSTWPGPTSDGLCYSETDFFGCKFRETFQFNKKRIKQRRTHGELRGSCVHVESGNKYFKISPLIIYYFYIFVQGPLSQPQLSYGKVNETVNNNTLSR